MSSLLARFAENLYWLGRYIERAENTARILHINETYARHDPSGPDWGHVLDLYADRDRFQENHENSDAASVLNFYILDRSNSTSIVSAVGNARENARTVRHLSSTEMWTQVNLFNTIVQALKARDFRLTNLSNLASELVQGCQTFEGIAEGTLMRGEAWCFFQLGKYLERADQTTRVLDIGYQRLSLGGQGALSSVQWHATVAISLRLPGSSLSPSCRLRSCRYCSVLTLWHRVSARGRPVRKTRDREAL